MRLTYRFILESSNIVL